VGSRRDSLGTEVALVRHAVLIVVGVAGIALAVPFVVRLVGVRGLWAVVPLGREEVEDLVVIGVQRRDETVEREDARPPPYQAFPGDMSQPGVEGDGPLPELARELLPGFGDGLLDDVAGIDTRAHPRVQVELDHALESASVAQEEGLKGLRIAAAGAVEEGLGIRGGVGHGKEADLLMMILQEDPPV